jgi:hypothetical protein
MPDLTRRLQGGDRGKNSQQNVPQSPALRIAVVCRGGVVAWAAEVG